MTRIPTPAHRAGWRALAGLALLASAGGVVGGSDPVAAASCARYVTTEQWPLERCDRGERVRVVQEQLNRTMGTQLVLDGLFGPRTEAAVIAFQQRSGLAPDGLVGPKTWARLTGATSTPAPTPTCDGYDAVTALPMTTCDSGLLVARLQQLLNDSGANLAVDGYFGAATRDAVTAFQSRQGLAVDGIVGPVTWWTLHTA